ncbi:MAG TPA: GAF domain-containing protein [Cyclobacteriaceae bacterium]|nr:GAF domain-containing protein [Cyclobacteriaceae bacterium]
MATVLTTVYFTGILISATVLYALQGDLSKDAAWMCCRIVGVTLFIGIVAIYFTARSRDERVVYLDRKQEATDEKTDENKGDSQLGEALLKNVTNSQQFLNEVCSRVGAGQGAIYIENEGNLELKYGYALGSERMSVAFQIGEGLVGRVAADGKALYLDELPEGYITVFSGLGNASPTRLALVPIRSGERVIGVIEIATFSDLNKSTLSHLEEAAGKIVTTTK